MKLMLIGDKDHKSMLRRVCLIPLESHGQKWARKLSYGMRFESHKLYT